MVRQVVSRSQRRMEKKQAVILLVLVLAVSLVSFTLGVMVGRGGSRAAGAEAEASAPPVRLPVASTEPTPPPGGERPAENLTFYDSLPKGEQPPLGSGINLPPAREKAAAVVGNPPATAPAKEKPAASAKAQAMPRAEAGDAPSTSAATISQAPSDGAYLVQIAAFRSIGDAGALMTKLEKKGYAVFTQKASLGEKGVWYRVYSGPFSTSEAAERVVARLKTEEKLAPLIRKR